MLRLEGVQMQCLFDQVLPQEVANCPRICSPRRAARRPGAAGADRGSLAGRGDGTGQLEQLPRQTNDPDVHLRAVDGGQAAHRLGLRDPGQGGIGLLAPAPLLPDRAHRSGTRRVDGAQADPTPGRRDRGGAEQAGDRQGGSRAPLSCPCGADRLHRGGGRRPLPLRRDALPAGSKVAGAAGAQARGADRRTGQRGSQPLAGGWAAGAPDLPHLARRTGEAREQGSG